MKQLEAFSNFIRRLLFFGVFGGLVYMAFGAAVLCRARHMIKVNLDDDIAAIVIGHSHAACGINDYYFRDLRNFAKSGEPLFYGCLKAKKILESCPNVKTVFIELSSSQLDRHMEDWILAEDKFNRALKSYYYLLETDTKLNFIPIHPIVYFKSQLLAERKLIQLLTGNNSYCNVDHMEWGGFEEINKTISDSLKVAKPRPKEDLHPFDMNINAIHAFINFAEERGVRVVLMRVPVHRTELDTHEDSFQSLVKEHFDKQEFLDYRRMSFPDDCFLDREHLNAKGAERFTKVFYQDWVSKNAATLR